MNKVFRDYTQSPPLNAVGLPDGKLEYDLRSGFRDLCRLYGFEEARRIVAGIINDEASGRRM